MYEIIKTDLADPISGYIPDPYADQVEEPMMFKIVPDSIAYDKSVDGNAKLLLSEIYSLSHKLGYCWATNDYFAVKFDCDKSTISRWVGQLIDAGYVLTTSKKVYAPDGKLITNRSIHLVNKAIDAYARLKQSYLRYQEQVANMQPDAQNDEQVANMQPETGAGCKYASYNNNKDGAVPSPKSKAAACPSRFAPGTPTAGLRVGRESYMDQILLNNKSNIPAGTVQSDCFQIKQYKREWPTEAQARDYMINVLSVSEACANSFITAVITPKSYKGEPVNDWKALAHTFKDNEMIDFYREKVKIKKEIKEIKEKKLNKAQQPQITERSTITLQRHERVDNSTHEHLNWSYRCSCNAVFEWDEVVYDAGKATCPSCNNFILRA